MAHKLAIAIAGAVSLGSYEAGVMYEIIRAIGEHNEHPDTGDDDRIEIDVITGASAGGMTAAILAQKLLFSADRLDDPYDNDLHAPWVLRADISKFLEMGPNDDPLTSLLSSDEIKRIADDMVLKRYLGRAVPTPRKHPAAADEIRLGLAMANLNGLDFRQRLIDRDDLFSVGGDDDDEGFVYTRHQDRFERVASHATDDYGFWAPVALAARACGAFPIAFRPLDIERDADQLPFAKSVQAGEHQNRFTYTDGGTFQNEPLGMAKGLVDQVDDRHVEHDRRFYLYVAPNPKRSGREAGFTERSADYVAMGKRLASAIFTQARFQDWILTHEINERVAVFDDQAEKLRGVLAGLAPVERAAFETTASKLLEVIYSRFPSDREFDSERLKEQFDAEFRELERRDPALAETWIETIQILERAADLPSKDIMRIYSITVESDEIAGEKLFAFGGFLNAEFREFDYDVGRRKAQEFLVALKTAHGTENGGEHLPLENFVVAPPTRSHSVNPKSEDLTEIDPAVRGRLVDTVSARLKLLVDHQDMAWYKRAALKVAIDLFGRPWLKKKLGLPA